VVQRGPVVKLTQEVTSTALLSDTGGEGNTQRDTGIPVIIITSLGAKSNKVSYHALGVIPSQSY
jgi:hypothetical protein